MADSENKKSGIRWGALLTSISEVCKVVAIPCMVVGSAFIFIALAAHTISILVPVGLLTAGAALLGTSIAAGYAASGYKDAENERNAQLQAKTTAHHVAQELEARNLIRADGKSWEQATRSEDAPQLPRTIN